MAVEGGQMTDWGYITFELDPCMAAALRTHEIALPFPPLISPNSFAALFPRWKPVSGGCLRINHERNGELFRFETIGSIPSLSLKAHPGDADYFNA